MEPLTTEEKKEFQEILSYFYGDQAYNWNINMNVLELLEELLRKNDSCSNIWTWCHGHFILAMLSSGVVNKREMLF